LFFSSSEEEVILNDFSYSYELSSYFSFGIYAQGSLGSFLILLEKPAQTLMHPMKIPILANTSSPF